MKRASLCSLAVLGLVAFGMVLADDTKKKDQKGTEKATIEKVDSANHTITVRMMGSDGKHAEKTLHLADGATYMDAHGTALKMDAFQPGDHVCITENDGKITQLKKDTNQTQAIITHVDAKKGTVSVRMKDENGKDINKTFHLTEDAEYYDSTGRVGAIDVFQSGDQVLIFEAEGKLKEVKKDTKGHTGDKDKKPNR